MGWEHVGNTAMICPKCGNLLSLEAGYHTDEQGPDGYRLRCQNCGYRKGVDLLIGDALEDCIFSLPPGHPALCAIDENYNEVIRIAPYDYGVEVAVAPILAEHEDEHTYEFKGVLKLNIESCKNIMTAILKFYNKNKGGSAMDVKIKRARFVHEVVRLYSQMVDAPIKTPEWDTMDDERKDNLIKYVDQLCRDGVLTTEKGAKQSHENWVYTRLKQGWTYGPEYDPVKKTHPDLVPYEELDPKEKMKDLVFLSIVDLACEVFR